MQNYTDFTDAVVLVTGASRGLGRAMALGFAECGAHIVATSRTAESCADVVAEIERLGRRAVAIPCHVGKWDDLPKLVEGALEAFGRIDVLVNNAGMAPVADASVKMSEALFDKILAVNLKGPFRLSALVAEHMRAAGGGAIINITSTAAIRPEPVYPVYAAAKGALNIVTRSQAMEFGPTVRVNAIMAGPFWTDISREWREDYDRNAPSAVKRIGRPEEIVSSALYLASPRSTYTTGAIIQLDGGIL